MSEIPAVPLLDTVDPGIGRRAALAEAALIFFRDRPQRRSPRLRAAA